MISAVEQRSPQAQKRFQKRINHRPPARVESANGRRDRLRNKKAFDQEHREQKTGAPVPAPTPSPQTDETLAAKLRAYREAEERRRDKKAEALERRKRKPRYYP